MELVQAQRLLQSSLELHDFNIYSLSKREKNTIILRKSGEYSIVDVPFLNNKLCLYIPFVYNSYRINWLKVNN